MDGYQVDGADGEASHRIDPVMRARRGEPVIDAITAMRNRDR